MKSFYRYLEYAFKTYIFLLGILVVSCGSRNSTNDNSKFKSTTASYYANKFDGKKTASGETYRHSKMTAANKSLAFGTRVEIVNVENEKSVIVIVNDRGPLKPSREFDLSQGAFKKIGNLSQGIIKIKYRILR
ncbi:septal ring lytic transglycosylase RlpA family protein [Epilithonimonas xixisoli]|uniref:Probable endolytic peptidoglycan transglycosylase RlpA n=1 Tax=Epilithonimonas xixisoli TaxID=1476462 RepID=A0A4R8I762_9FLAO|nr:septal ring lytic transglycosylase RlpA family protein [Epilithonimonas xixisoli]TDX84827.1 rare lipoprotein A [Epilithonimonas xixisoli]